MTQDNARPASDPFLAFSSAPRRRISCRRQPNPYRRLSDRAATPHGTRPAISAQLIARTGSSPGRLQPAARLNAEERRRPELVSTPTGAARAADDSLAPESYTAAILPLRLCPEFPVSIAAAGLVAHKVGSVAVGPQIRCGTSSAALASTAVQSGMTALT